MLSRLDQVLGFHEQAMALRAKRQQLIAANIANADTPNYKARDFNFAQTLQAVQGINNNLVNLEKTSPAHFSAADSGLAPQVFKKPYQQNNFDLNTVDLDVERQAFADNAVHYEADVSFAHDQIKGLLSVLQG